MDNTIDKVAWIQIVDRQVLSTRSRGKATFYFPGGKREPGESDQECLVREIREELAVELLPDTLQFLGQFAAQAHGHREGVRVQMRCYTGEYVGALSADSEIEELIWLRYADKLKTSPVDQLIFDWLNAHHLID